MYMFSQCWLQDPSALLGSRSSASSPLSFRACLTALVMRLSRSRPAQTWLSIIRIAILAVAGIRVCSMVDTWGTGAHCKREGTSAKHFKVFYHDHAREK